MCLRVFQDEINIWIHGPSKIHFPPQWGWASSNSLRAGIVQKWKKEEFNPFYYRLAVEVGPLTSSPLALRLGFIPLTPLVLSQPLDSDSDSTTAPTLLGLQLAHGRSWDFKASKIKWAISHNKFPFIYGSVHTHMVLYPIGSVSLQNPD